MTVRDTRSFTPSSDAEAQRFHVWFGYPKQSGQYVSDFTLREPSGRPVARAKSKPFTILAPAFFTPLRAPTYEARLPRGWSTDKRYEAQGRNQYVTKQSGPHGESILVDTTLNYRGDPRASAVVLRRAERPHLLNYRDRGFHALRLGRVNANLFFVLEGDGYAIRADGPYVRRDEIRTVAREIVRSLKPTP
jgi:hypothetical protein